VPNTVTPEIVTFEFPLLVSVVVNEPLLPTFTFPKLKFDELSPRTRVAATPVPLKEMASGELGALLTRVIVPVTLPAVFGPNTALNVAALPAPIVTGAVMPVVLKPAPVTVTEETVTDALPPFVRLMVCELLVPVDTLPNAAVVGVAASCACIPVPLKVMVAGEPGALLTIEILPVSLPGVGGVNFAVNDALLLALIVIGMVAPLMLNPVPEGSAWVTVSAAFPGFVSVTVCDPVLPTETLPKATLAGLIVSCGCEAVPDPDKAITSGEAGALLTTETLPVALPAVVGENLAVNDVLCPAVSVCAARPEMLNPVPVALPCEIATLAVPEFLRVTLTDALSPTSRLPKLMLVGFAVRFPCTPVPPSAIDVVGLLAVLVIRTLPATAPTVVGANCAVKLVL
jgi:hypothetical protein